MKAKQYIYQFLPQKIFCAGINFSFTCMEIWSTGVTYMQSCQVVYSSPPSCYVIKLQQKQELLSLYASLYDHLFCDIQIQQIDSNRYLLRKNTLLSLCSCPEHFSCDCNFYQGMNFRVGYQLIACEGWVTQLACLQCLCIIQNLFQHFLNWIFLQFLIQKMVMGKMSDKIYDLIHICIQFEEKIKPSCISLCFVKLLVFYSRNHQNLEMIFLCSSDINVILYKIHIYKMKSQSTIILIVCPSLVEKGAQYEDFLQCYGMGNGLYWVFHLNKWTFRVIVRGLWSLGWMGDMDFMVLSTWSILFAQK